MYEAKNAGKIQFAVFDQTMHRAVQRRVAIETELRQAISAGDFRLHYQPIVALIMTLTETGALLIDALARSNDQQLAGAIIFLLTASIVGLNFVTDILLSVLDPRIRKGIMG